tara:strand:- start:1956 stop:2228 length:273 start_codon:yes stop_codon:yes gene_type:complete
MSEFKFDEEIEVSTSESFERPHWGKFICDTDKLTLPNSLDKYLVLSDDGQVIDYPYARKIEPKVMVSISGCRGTHYISKTLADKIVAGDV